MFVYKFGILCAISALLSTLHYAAAENPPAELEPLWKPFPGQRDEGGCDQDLQDLKDSYSQAIVLSKAAIAGLSNIEGPKPEDPKEGQEWDRQARIAKAMFNLETDPASGITSGDMLKTLQKIFSEWIHQESDGSAKARDREFQGCKPIRG